MISEEELERVFQIFFDIKKELHYCKTSGQWCWTDRGEYHGQEQQFPTALDAMRDAVDPYLHESEQ